MIALKCFSFSVSLKEYTQQDQNKCIKPSVADVHCCYVKKYSNTIEKYQFYLKLVFYIFPHGKNFTSNSPVSF